MANSNWGTTTDDAQEEPEKTTEDVPTNTGPPPTVALDPVDTASGDDGSFTEEQEKEIVDTVEGGDGAGEEGDGEANTTEIQDDSGEGESADAD